MIILETCYKPYTRCGNFWKKRDGKYLKGEASKEVACTKCYPIVMLMLKHQHLTCISKAQIRLEKKKRILVLYTKHERLDDEFSLFMKKFDIDRIKLIKEK